MDKQTIKEIDILGRMEHLLDEYSVQYAAEQDGQFREYIERLHQSIAHEQQRLMHRRRRTAR